MRCGTKTLPHCKAASSPSSGWEVEKTYFVSVLSMRALESLYKMGLVFKLEGKLTLLLTRESCVGFEERFLLMSPQNNTI